MTNWGSLDIGLATLQSFSWLRSYHLAIGPGQIPADGAPEWLPSGYEAVDCASLGFFDIQSIRRHHVARFRATDQSVQLNGVCTGKRVPVSTHCLLHGSGFMAIRITCDASSLNLDSSNEVVARIGDLFWGGNRDQEWTLSEGESTPASVREALNLVYLSFLESLEGRDRTGPELAELAQEDSRGCEYLHHLAESKKSKVTFPFPVSLCTHFEFSPVGAMDPDDSREALKALACEESAGGPALEGGVFPGWWMIRERKSVLLCERPDKNRSLDTSCPDAVQVLEYLNLRLAALWSVQRDTQRILIENDFISRDQVSEWHRIVVTTTDDWSLHTRFGSILGQVSENLALDPGFRSMDALKSQVETNIATFRERLDVASDRAGVFLGVLFGVVAAVSITPTVKTLISGGEDPDQFATKSWIESVSIDLVVLIVIGAIGMWWLLRRTRRIRASTGTSWAISPPKDD